MTTVEEAVHSTEHRPNVFVRIYRGETSFDFIGRRRLWYMISGIVIVAGLVSLTTRGLNLGIDFSGGSSWTVNIPPSVSTSQVQTAVQDAGLANPTVQVLGKGNNRQVQVQADLNKQSRAQQVRTKSAVQVALGKLSHTSPSQVSSTDVSASWGSQITHKALVAVLVFFVVVVAYISVRFEWKMAIAALIAVIHDLLVTIGIYSLAGFQVTPDTVIAVLTILGYSLYDTVVVFDRVRENTKGLGASGRMTYEDVVNLSMNQTLARSINTSLVAILPVLSVLIIGAQLLGATTLQYFGLALVIGLTSGAYSSIFIAAPVLSTMKEREPRYQSIRQKLENRADRTGLLTPRAAAALAAAGATSGSAARAARAGAARATGSRRQGQVLRPGAARGTTPGAPEVAPDDVAEVGVAGSAAGNGRQAAGSGSAGAGGSRSSRGSRPAARRPPPRKKGGKRGGRRR